MTFKPTDKRSVDATARPRTGLLGGRWLPQSELCVPIDDIGFRQGATGVERLRTYNGQVFQLDAHMDRWQHTVDAIGINGLPRREATAVLIDQLIGRNRAFVDAVGDFGITMFATPGTVGSHSPTFGMHLNVIDHGVVDRRRAQGQPLVITDVSQPPESAWPRSIKVRSRLHYYLADQIAAARDPDAVGLLLDSDGGITETSIASVAIVEKGVVVSPSPDRVLGGVTQQVVWQLADECGLSWVHATISAERLSDADEVLLMGTDGGLWYASHVDRREISLGRPGEVFRQLRMRFDDLVGYGN